MAQRHSEGPARGISCKLLHCTPHAGVSVCWLPVSKSGVHQQAGVIVYAWESPAQRIKVTCVQEHSCMCTGKRRQDQDLSQQHRCITM